MIKAILFDLDGTLLPVDKDTFLAEYFNLLGDFFRDLVENPGDMIREVTRATAAMVKRIPSDYGKTNRQVFLEHFLPAVGLSEDVAMPKFAQFYNGVFKKLQVHTQSSAVARKIAAYLGGRGYRLVLATNPVFPIEAVRERMSWAGISGINWDLVTTYEDFHTCKPSPDYYLEIIGRVGCTPLECIMAGNNMAEDMSASAVGIKSFLITDYLINESSVPFKPYWEGTMSEFSEYVYRCL